jgi:hypothetical protein
MHIVHIKASKKQLSKLRNGHKVRISPAMEGQGFNLIIDPGRFNTVSKTFNKGKGTTIQLTPAEITANQEQAPNMQGSGIFGRKFDDFVRDTIGSKAKDVIYNAADTLKPAIKQGIDRLAERAPEATAAALATLATASGNPELAPMAATFGHRLGKHIASKSDIAKDYFDNPEKYQKSVKRAVSSNAGGPRNRIAPATLQGQAKQNEFFNAINKELGTHYGNLAKATMDNAVAHMERSGVETDRVKQNVLPFFEQQGQGLYLSNSGGRGLHRKKERSSIGRGSSMVASQAHLPPALVSQPFSANFQFQHTLPPAYARFSKGGGLSL